MSTKIRVIIDNIPNGELKGEWGLSLLCEHNGKMILADTGASNLFADNLKKLGFDIAAIDYATLSHAHYDHSNGMECFFRNNSRASFFLREGTGEDCYAKKFIFRKYIGIPRRILSRFPDRFRFVSGDYELYAGTWLIPHKTEGLAAIGKRELMYRKTAKGFVPDDFAHEQSLVLDTEKGLVIINCCSHGGAANIINEVARTFPDKKVYGIIGGFHLFNKSEEEIRSVSRLIKQTGISYVCTGHCTKDRAYGIMQQELGDILHQLQVGKVMEF